MIGQAPDIQLRAKKKGCMKSCSPTESSRSKSCTAKTIQRKSCVRGPIFQERWQKVVCPTQHSKKVPNVCGGSASGENACPTTWLVSEFGEEAVGSRSSRRLQLARHAHNKCIASGQHKRSVGHASFVCGSAERYSNCNRCYRDFPPNPARETTTTIPQCNSDNLTPLAAHMSGAHLSSP